MKKLIVIALCILCIIMVAPVKATIIPITSTETIFNFDFTSLMDPEGDYSTVKFHVIFDESDPISVGIDSMITRVYGGLDGTELLQVRNDTTPGFSFESMFNDDGTEYGPAWTANPIFDPMNDGIFSFGLQMDEGSASLVSFTTCLSWAVNGDGPSITYPVPEPATMILFGLGGLLFRKRRA